VETLTDKPETVARRRYNTLALTWIDFLVIAAIILTFAAIVTTTLGRAKAATHKTGSTPEFSTEIGQSYETPNLLKARIRLAAGGPWG
jgi:large-conductance mechanosensitive channel